MAEVLLMKLLNSRTNLWTVLGPLALMSAWILTSAWCLTALSGLAVVHL
jgi:hypothetical protein